MRERVYAGENIFQRQRLNSENSLLEACRVLFGEDIILSHEFLIYLQEEGINSAYRKRAKEIHPDKATALGISIEQSQKDFVSLQVACEMLRNHIAARKISNRLKGFVDRNRKEKKSTAYTLPEQRMPFGRFLYRIGIIEWRQLINALAWQKSGRMRIGELGVELGYLDKDSVVIILKRSSREGAFGITAQKLGLLTADEVRQLLLKQRRMQKKIGQFFVEQGLLNTMELHQLLSQCNEHNRRIERLSGK